MTNGNCGGGGLADFSIENYYTFTPSPKLFKYKCAIGGQYYNEESKTTGNQDGGGGDVIFLDRHDINCGDNSLLTYFNPVVSVISSANNTLRYDYSCHKSKEPLTCTTYSTPWVAKPSDVKNLPAVACSDKGAALNRFKLKNNSDYTQVAYDYTCCK
jgi:hypothetical protein